MTQQRYSFPVVTIDRDDVEYALGFDPELTDKQMEILTAALHDAIRKRGFQQLLEDTLDDLEKTLGIVVPGQTQSQEGTND